jgi:hypothetical protein
MSVARRLKVNENIKLKEYTISISWTWAGTVVTLEPSSSPTPHPWGSEVIKLYLLVPNNK